MKKREPTVNDPIINLEDDENKIKEYVIFIIDNDENKKEDYYQKELGKLCKVLTDLHYEDDKTRKYMYMFIVECTKKTTLEIKTLPFVESVLYAPPMHRIV